MSRYPFRDYADDLLSSRIGVYSAATYSRERRRLDRMFRDVLRMFENGDLSTTSPARFTEDDIRKYLSWRRSLNFSRAEYSHEIFTLRSICDYAGNNVVNRVLRLYPLLKPVSSSRRLPSLTDDQASRSVDACKKLVEAASFIDVRAAALFMIAYGCGLRTKELRLLDMSSVDFDNHRLSLIHVKGEGSYGNARVVYIPPETWDIFSSYLAQRSEIPGSGAVFVTVHGSRMVPNSMRVDLERVSRVSGIHYDFRILRRTFGQRLINAGLPVEAVSVVLGHSTTRTTEHYYCRLSNEEALSRIEEIYKKNPKIDGKVLNFSAGGSRHFSSVQSSPVNHPFRTFSVDSPIFFGTLMEC